MWAIGKESSYLPKKMASFRMIKVCLDRHSGMLGVRVVRGAEGASMYVRVVGVRSWVSGLLLLDFFIHAPISGRLCAQEIN